MTPMEIIPETARALSAPVTKLIEAVSAGCGRLYRPREIRHIASAEGDALVIMEEAKARASDVAMRAAKRLLDVEERRQINIEAIASEAEQLLPAEVSPEPVAPDWAARFFAECQDVGDEQMRSVWAKLLAGEVAQPRSFSHRTMSILKHLAPDEAQLFNTLCRVSFRGARDTQVFPMFMGTKTSEYWNRLGLTFSAIQRLVDAGLVAYHSVGLQVENATSFLLRTSHVSLRIAGDGKTVIKLGYVALSASGSELATICEWQVPDERLEQIAAMLKPPLQAFRGFAQPIGDGNRYSFLAPGAMARSTATIGTPRGSL